MGDRLVKNRPFGIFNRQRLKSRLHDFKWACRSLLHLCLGRHLALFAASFLVSIYFLGQRFMLFSPLKPKFLIGGILFSGIFAGIVLLGPVMEFVADAHYRLELAVYEFRQSESELAYCSNSSTSCRSLSKRFKDAWLGFNSGRKKNPLLLYKRYKVYLR